MTPQFYNWEQVSAFVQDAMSKAAKEAAQAATQEVLARMNLDNHTQETSTPCGHEEGVDSMAKERIRRRVTIKGVQRWITGRDEQEYAQNLFMAMGGVQAAPAEAKHLFKPYAEEWFSVCSKPNIREATAITYERQLTCHIFPAIGDMAIEDITPMDLQRLFATMDDERGKKATATKTKVKVVLNLIFGQAIEDGIISKNPMKSKKITVKGTTDKMTQPYSVEQMKYLAAHIGDLKGDDDRAFLALHVFHPFRLEEVLGLRWQDIDMDKALIHIRSTVTHPDRNQPRFSEETKTAASVRTIQLVEEARKYLHPGMPNEFVVGGEKPLSYQQVRKMRTRIQKQTGFDESITPRRFRTTVLTDLYDVTKDIKLTQAAAGHTTSAMTLKHYVKGRGTAGDTAAAIKSVYCSTAV